MYQALKYTKYPSFNDGLGDFFGPDFSDTGNPCGMSYPSPGVDNPGRVVFLSYPFDALPTNGAAPNNAATLMKNIISFLAPTTTA